MSECYGVECPVPLNADQEFLPSNKGHASFRVGLRCPEDLTFVPIKTKRVSKPSSRLEVADKEAVASEQ
jgi:hypothetical protein